MGSPRDQGWRFGCSFPEPVEGQARSRRCRDLDRASEGIDDRTCPSTDTPGSTDERCETAAEPGSQRSPAGVHRADRLANPEAEIGGHRVHSTDVPSSARVLSRCRVTRPRDGRNRRREQRATRHRDNGTFTNPTKIPRAEPSTIRPHPAPPTPAHRQTGTRSRPPADRATLPALDASFPADRPTRKRFTRLACPSTGSGNEHPSLRRSPCADRPTPAPERRGDGVAAAGRRDSSSGCRLPRRNGWFRPARREIATTTDPRSSVDPGRGNEHPDFPLVVSRPAQPAYAPLSAELSELSCPMTQLSSDKSAKGRPTRGVAGVFTPTTPVRQSP